MKLSIITINYNNATGLQKTLKSVADQRLLGDGAKSREGIEVEHIIIDGASTDNSVDVIRDYENKLSSSSKFTLSRLSEPDSGIYNAMNKGIEIALGHREVDSFNRSTIGNKTKGGSAEPDHYIQILNSGDIYASNDVISRMASALQQFASRSSSTLTSTSTSSSTLDSTSESPSTSQSPHRLIVSSPKEWPAILYGNMIKKNYATGKIIGKSGRVPYTLRNYYTSTMNHDCCWIQAQLFNEDHFGLYDENLRIVSDWKWFLCAIALGMNPNRQMVISPIRPVYVDIDITIFDASGISEQNLALRNQERRQVLEELLPPAILADYDKHVFDMEQMDNLRKHPWAYKLVWTIERVLNRLDHRNFSKRKK